VLKKHAANGEALEALETSDEETTEDT
jgi:hypothetical protein